LAVQFPLNDPVSTLTHGIGALVFAVLGIEMVGRARGSRWRQVGLAVFVGSAVLLLAASAAFHASPDGTPARAVLQRIDHAAIFALIAGTFTPIHAIRFKGWARWGAIGGIWALAGAGIALKTLFFGSVPEWLGIVLYLTMGWLGLGAIVATWRRWGIRAATLMVAAGLTYTLGAVVELLTWPTLVTGVVGPHEVFHVLVLAGLTLFWIDIRGIALVAEPDADVRLARAA
jgi:channel protein (hemolysin III family)